LDAFYQAVLARKGNELDLGLRDQEHARLTEHILNTYGPVLGRAIAGTLVPAWSGAKAVAQALPTPISQTIDKAMPTDMKLASPTTTPPSWREVQAGLKPAFGDFSSLMKFLGVQQ